MSIREIDRTSTLDPGTGGSHWSAKMQRWKDQGLGQIGEHGQNLAAREVQSAEKEKDVESNKEEKEGQVAAAAPTNSC